MMSCSSIRVLLQVKMQSPTLIGLIFSDVIKSTKTNYWTVFSWQNIYILIYYEDDNGNNAEAAFKYSN